LGLYSRDIQLLDPSIVETIVDSVDIQVTSSDGRLPIFTMDRPIPIFFLMPNVFRHVVLIKYVETVIRKSLVATKL
jgi:hypothetical protein